MKTRWFYLVLAVCFVGVGVEVSWAGCTDEAPLFASVMTHDVYNTVRSYTVTAKGRITGCQIPTIRLKVDGVNSVPGASVNANTTGTTYWMDGNGEASLTITLTPQAASTFNLVYTATNLTSNMTNTINVPIRFNTTNSSPALSPVADLSIPLGQNVAFSVEATDVNSNMPITEDGLRVEGIPASFIASKIFTRLTSSDIVQAISLTPNFRGVFKVQIRAKDSSGSLATSEMRIGVY